LILGARSLSAGAKRNTDCVNRWAMSLAERRGCRRHDRVMTDRGGARRVRAPYWK
jgi:hypothetical protein